MSTSNANPVNRETHPDGSFKANASSFRNWISEGGKFPPKSQRYHLYASYACPYATRTLIARKLKGLEDIVSVTILSPLAGDNGWPFAHQAPFPRADDDPLYGSKFLKDLYLRANSHHSERFTIPVLWDKQQHTIVSNDSGDIVRIFNQAFNGFLPKDKANIDISPQGLLPEIDKFNERIYGTLNVGVYKAGFAPSQQNYEVEVKQVFETLDYLEELLTGKDFVFGDALTEADIRLWVSAVRFDTAYYGIFKCNLRTIRDGYPAINAWMKRLYWNIPAFKESTDFEHIKGGYYSLASFNPSKIVPMGPLPPIEPL